MRHLCLIGLALPVLLHAQAPGGVSTNLAVWYKADLNVTGNPVSAWNTSGGSATSFNLTQGTAANRPPVIAGSTNYKRYNYNPRIDFVKASSTRLENTNTSPNLYGTAGAIFLITDQNQTDGYGTALTYSANTSSQRIQIKPSFRIQTSTGSSGYTADWSAPTQWPATSAAMLHVSGLGATATHRLNSVPIACNNCGSATYNPAITTGLRVGRNANGTGSEYVDCDIGEIIIYSDALTAAQIDRIESYLAIKYGITRGGNAGTSSAYDYVNSAGTTIWNKTANAGYNNDIAGIGRDDGSALVQKQSISVNNNESVSIGLVGIAASNAANTNSFSANQSFLVWGNDGGAQQSVFNDPNCFASLPTGVQARIQRRWKVQATSFSQSVTVGFETSAIVGYTPLANLRLLVDNDGGNWTNATVYSGATLNGGRIEFPGVTLSNSTPFFTLATTSFLTTPLPVELLEFTAVPDGRQVLARWSTASESGSDRFELERSPDGQAFARIATLPAAGNSHSVVAYDATDAAPLPGTSYYRLKQIDADGSWTYSPTQVVSMLDDHALMRLLYDPLGHEAMLAGYRRDLHGPIALFDARGALLPTSPWIDASGMVRLAGMPSGLYIIQVADQRLRLMVER